MRTTGLAIAAAIIAGCGVGLTASAFAQTVEDAIKFDISPPLASIRQPAKAQGAFLQEHIVKKIPLPPAKLAAVADTVLQKKAPASLPVVTGQSFAGVGRENYSIRSDPPDTNGSVGKTH